MEGRGRQSRKREEEEETEGELKRWRKLRETDHGEK